MTDYSLWEVILNGNKVLKRKVGKTEQEYEPTTAEEKQDRRNEMKAKGTLLMALPNKDQLKSHAYKDAKLLMEAIEKSYGGNKESKKVQRTLLKQQYENFAGSSSEIMDQTFDRLQKLITQLEIQGKNITQEDMNLKLLRRSSSTSHNPQNVAFVSSNSTNSNSSTNEADNTAYRVSVVHTQSNPTSGDNLSDTVICAFLASQPNYPQMSREDLEQIDPGDSSRVVISDTEEDLKDPSKQGRRIAEIDQNLSISLVQYEGTSWIQEDAKIQGRTSTDTEILLDQEEPTELVRDLGSGEKGVKEIITANISVSTASATPKVSTAVENLVYIKRSAEKRKDKGKAIMKEDESVQKKTKKQLEQERLGHEEAIRLQEHINEEERQRIARDAEKAKQLQEEFDIARQEQEVVAEADQAYDIDWNDPVVLRYHALQNRSFYVAEVRKNMCLYLKNQGGYKQSHFKRMSYEYIRLIFERVWDQNHAFVPKDSEIEKEVMKRPGFDFPQKSMLVEFNGLGL
ncbi:hypothetical protein Tco_0812916 [Tanacetum coccineum]